MARDSRPFTAVVAADGTATATIRVSDGINTWTVDQVSTRMDTAPVGATCRLTYNGRQISRMIATGGVADGPPPITLRPADTAAVEWAGCTPGDVGTVIIFFDDGRATT